MADFRSAHEYKLRSTAPNLDLLWYIDRAIWHLRDEVPEAYISMVNAASGLTIDVRTASTSGTVRVHGDRVEVFGPGFEPDVIAFVKESAIIDLIDCKRLLKDTLGSGDLEITGTSENLERLIMGLRFFLQGAIRSRGVQDLLDRYRHAFCK